MYSNTVITEIINAEKLMYSISIPATANNAALKIP